MNIVPFHENLPDPEWCFPEIVTPSTSMTTQGPCFRDLQAFGLLLVELGTLFLNRDSVVHVTTLSSEEDIYAHAEEAEAET